MGRHTFGSNRLGIHTSLAQRGSSGVGAWRKCMRYRFLVALAVGGLLSTQAVRAGDISFDNGGGDSKWENNLNWENDTLPGSGDTAHVGSAVSSPQSAIVDDTTGTANAGSLMIGDADSTFGTLTMNGGTLNVGSTTFVGGNGANAGGNGTFIMTNGVFSTNTFLIGNSNTSVTLASGSVHISGGAFNINNGTFQGNRFGTASVLLDGGTMNLSGTTGLIVSNGTDDTSGTFTVDGGTLLMGTGSINVSRNGGLGTINVKSGYVDFGTGLVSLVNNSTGTAGLVVSNGTVHFGTMRTDSGGASLSGSSVLISGGSISGGTITVSSGKNQLGDSQQFYLSQADPNVPTDLSIQKIGQGNAIEDIEFNGGTLTIGSIGFNTGPGNSRWQTMWNAGTLSPGAAGVAGGGSDFGITYFQTLNPLNVNFADFWQGENHHLHIDVGDGGAKDQLAFGNGSATLNGTIDVNYIGIDPHVGDSFDIIVAGSANAINLVAADLANNIPGTRLISHNPGIEYSLSLATTVNTNDTLRLTITAIPEPAMLGFAGVGAVMLLDRRRGRSRRTKLRTGAGTKSPNAVTG